MKLSRIDVLLCTEEKLLQNHRLSTLQQLKGQHIDNTPSWSVSQLPLTGSVTLPQSSLVKAMYLYYQTWHPHAIDKIENDVEVLAL